MDILFVEEEGVPVVAWMLAERLTVIPSKKEECFIEEATLAQPAKELAESGIPIVQGVAIVAQFIVGGKRPAFWRVIRMMAGNGQVSDKERSRLGLSIDPAQDPVDGGRFVHTEAGMVIAADITGIFQCLEATVLHDRFH